MRGKVSKLNISAESNKIFFKFRVTGPWDHKVSVSAKKSKNKFQAYSKIKICIVSSFRT